MLQAIGLSIIGGFGSYLLARISTGGKGGAKPQAPGLVEPTVPGVPTLPQAPVETKPPAPAPAPPVDKSPQLPTPVAPPAPVVAPPPPPAPVVTAPPAIEPPVVKAPVEVAPPAPPPPPPVDTAPALPTPPVDRPDRPWSDAVVEVDSPARGPAISTPATEPSVPVDTANGPPAGFDPTIASTLAPNVAANIKAKQYDFDRAQLKRFQTAAGLASDGIYGNDSWGALLYFTSDAPRALYQPNVPTPYVWGPWVSRVAPSAPSSTPAPSAPSAPGAAAPAAPATPAVDVGPVPPDGFAPTTAKKMAKQTAANIDSKGVNYSRDQLKSFQRAAGIDADGIYGGGSRRALMFYGVARPPQPLFKPTATPATYPWESQAKAALG